MQIREAVEADRDAVWAMLEPVFRKGDTYAVDPDITQTDAMAYWFAPQRRVHVAEDAGQLLGSYYITRNFGGGGSHVCNCGYVTDAAARGRGVARAMLAHSLELAPQMGFRAMMYNSVISTNTRAVDTWARAGFEVVGRLPEAFLHPDAGYVDALVMYRAV